MKPEDVMLLPLTQDTKDPYCIRDAERVRVAAARLTTREAAALVTACNAYPLSLALAEAAKDALALASGEPRSCGCRSECVHVWDNMQSALSAFLAHRNTEAKP